MDLKLQRVNSLVSGRGLEVVFSVIWNFSRNVQYFGVCRQENDHPFHSPAPSGWVNEKLNC